MRSCLLSLLLLALVAANAYAIWQIHELRSSVEDIRSQMVQERENERESMIEHARNAIEALGRGELKRAEAELDRLSELMEDTRELAGEQRRRLQDLLAEARVAVAQRGARASKLLEDLRDDLTDALSQRTKRRTPEEGENGPAEP